LKKGQKDDLILIDTDLEKLLQDIEDTFKNRSFEDINMILSAKQVLLDHVSESIDRQVKRIRTEESSKKNSTLYFGILVETKDLISAIMNLLELYQGFAIRIAKNKISS
jgi:hypothetical protein